jgi:hypothetical protein
LKGDGLKINVQQQDMGKKKKKKVELCCMVLCKIMHGGKKQV